MQGGWLEKQTAREKMEVCEKIIMGEIWRSGGNNRNTYRCSISVPRQARGFPTLPNPRRSRDQVQ